MAGQLKIIPSTTPGTLTGTFAYFGGQPGLQFSTVLDGKGGAQAVLSLAGGTEQATVMLVDRDNVQMLWGGQAITGTGALSAQASAALAQFAASPLARAVALAALELGCGSTADPAQLAAVLAPWQLVLKYLQADRLEQVKAVASQASCAYFADPTKPTTALAPALMQLAFDDPIPNVFGFFPLDGVGAIEITAANRSMKLAGATSGPCSALCRGACGPDCTTNNCTFKGTGRCQTDNSGRRTGYWQTSTVYSCGSHQACREHDDCYDACNVNQCGTWAAATCRRGCDLDTARKWPTECAYWARGYGAFDSRIDFEYPDPPRYDPILCPIASGGVDAALSSPDAQRDTRGPDLVSQPETAGGPDLPPADLPVGGPMTSDGPVTRIWRMTNFEAVFEPHDGCFKMGASSNGQATISGDCQIYESQAFTETDTFTWTPPPEIVTIRDFQPYPTLWWQGTMNATTALSIPSAYNKPRPCLDIRITQTSHPADTYLGIAGAPPCGSLAPSASLIIAAQDGGGFQRDPHSGTPPLDPSPLVVQAKLSVTGASAGYYVLNLRYTYTRQ